MNIEDIYRYYPTNKSCINLLEKIKWGGKPVCPYCGSERFTINEERYHCNLCNTSYSVTVDTALHKTKMDIQKWFYAIVLLKENYNISARELAKQIGTTKNSAWLLLKRIREGMINNDILIRKLIQYDFETNDIK